MATKARIAQVDESGHYKSICCHYDAYPKGIGKILITNYSTPEKLNEILNKGDLALLLDTSEDSVKYEFRENTFTNNAHDNTPVIDIQLTDLFDRARSKWEDYIYLFDFDYEKKTGHWMIFSLNDDIITQIEINNYI
jgi:hypothetical protein